jgi:hypothetical protein
MARERCDFHKLLEANPNYFGQLSKSKFVAINTIQGNTSFEKIECLGLFPEKNLVEAIIEIKQPYGFIGDLCHKGSFEYIRFYLDWDRDGDFNDPDEDLGFVALEVHDIPGISPEKKETFLCYAVSHRFKPHPSHCKEPYIIPLRAVLAWEQIPTSPDFHMVWGNIMQCMVQIDPEGGMTIVSNLEVVATADKSQAALSSTQKTKVDPHRADFHALLAENPNFFGTAAASPLAAINEKKFDTTYEKLECVGLDPLNNNLEAVFQVKLPYGFKGDLCHAGSHEFIRFFVDWDNDGDFNDPLEDVGVAAVRVHDISEVKPGVPKTYLCYATLHNVKPPFESTCKTPLIRKVRAVLSWEMIPPGPNGPVVWGNFVECKVQFRPSRQRPRIHADITDPVENECVLPITTACILDGHPVTGVQITGSAEGTLFNHYTLSYRPAGYVTFINVAVVYPNCVRATIPDLGASSQVLNGVLGYLDISILPPGVLQYDVLLEVFLTGGGSVTASGSFKLQIASVEIKDIAHQPRVFGEDPFNLGVFRNLIKHTNSPSSAVSEQSIGGTVSVNGAAYVQGCDKIMSQYVLAVFGPFSPSPVPIEPDATGGIPIISPVIYDGTPAHPWSSGCSSPFNSNVVAGGGNLVAHWDTQCCLGPSSPPCPPGFYGMPYLNNTSPLWNTGGLNGRYVVLLEVQDVPVGGPPPVNKTVRQVVVWIDNQSPLASIGSIGSSSGCGDVHLKDFVHPRSRANINGKAYDPPIDPAYPQQTPNENFGGWSLSFYKNGGIFGGTIASGTNRVGLPSTWPAVPTLDDVFIAWDIVLALDAGSPPSPYVSAGPKLYRGERCAFVFYLTVSDTTWVGDGGNHNAVGPFPYAVTIINDIPNSEPFPEPAAP